MPRRVRPPARLLDELVELGIRQRELLRPRGREPMATTIPGVGGLFDQSLPGVKMARDRSWAWWVDAKRAARHRETTRRDPEPSGDAIEGPGRAPALAVDDQAGAGRRPVAPRHLRQPSARTRGANARLPLRRRRADRADRADHTDRREVPRPAHLAPPANGEGD